MTNWGFEDNNTGDLGNNTELDGPKALRQAYEAMKKQNEELSGQLTSFLEEQRTAKMAQVFESLGVPGAQAVYNGPADPQKAKEWVDTMAQVFGNGQPQQAAETVATPPALPASMQAQFERLNGAGSDGTPVGNVEAAQAAVNDATDLKGLINSFQNMNGV
jgi:hypothetical protein